MDASVEDALVDWFEMESVFRSSAVQARHGGVVNIACAHSPSGAALERLFRKVDDAPDTSGVGRPAARRH